MRRLVLPSAVLLALAAALAGAILGKVPARGLPAIALGSTLVWRVEVAAIVFTAAYGAIVTARLALHGHTYTRVGSSGIEIPQVARPERAETASGTADLDARLDTLQTAVAVLSERLDVLEHPTQVLLSPDGEDA